MLTRRHFLGSAACSVAAVRAEGPSAVGNSLPAADYDLVVAGGSATGVCAAVTAARQGLKVALVEYNAFFGGMATAALVPVWHSLYSTDGKTQIIGGLTDEIERRMLARGEAELKGNRADPSVGCYLNVAALQLTLDEFVRAEKGITSYLKAHVVDAVCDRPGHVVAAVVEDKSGRHLLRANYFIDATGDADLAARAGFATWTLPKCDLQAHTLCAIVSGVDDLHKVYGGKFNLNAILRPDSGAGLKHVFGWTAPVVGGTKNLRFIAATRIASCDPSIAADLTEGLFEGRDQLRRIVDTVNRNFPMPDGRRMALVAIGSDLGVRESRHIKARYKVTEKDVLYGRHFDDCIGKGSYRVDIHEGTGITFRYLNGKEDVMTTTPEGQVTWKHRRWRTDEGPYPTWYEIPFSAMVPENAENLVCAGRMIDCERAAFGALRVMVNCNQMGEAAGWAAVRHKQRFCRR